jgi:NTE family protein
MNSADRTDTGAEHERYSGHECFERQAARESDTGQVVLVLQGGGALGSIRPASTRRCHEAGIEPTGLRHSIGAIIASLIAGNSPQNRLSRLREFWKRMEQNPVWNFRDIFPGFNEKPPTGRR